jgi:hypothetical protein
MTPRGHPGCVHEAVSYATVRVARFRVRWNSRAHAGHPLREWAPSRGKSARRTTLGIETLGAGDELGWSSMLMSRPEALPSSGLPAGRIAPDERSALHRPQSGARGLGAIALGLALVERPRPRDRRRSRSGPGPRLGRVLRPVGLPRLARNAARCCGARTRACRVETRLDTPVGTDNMSGPGVGTSADAARRSACAKVSPPNVREKRVLARGRPKRKSGAPEDAAAQGCLFAGREE